MTRAEMLHQAWRTLPVAALNDIIGNGTCLVLAPHPDDESLGCGGLIAACCAAGRPPVVAILTDGAASHPGSRACPPDRLRLLRAREAHEAMMILGLPLNRLIFLGQQDGAAPHEGPRFTSVVEMVCALVRRERDCETILAPWLQDPHCDHESAALIAAAVAEACGIRHLSYPVWGWTLPPDAQIEAPAPSGLRLDISEFQAFKQRAIHAHKSQYGRMITDDPAGFQLPAGLLAAFEPPYETFLSV